MQPVILLIVAMLSVFRLTGYFTEPRLTDAEIHAVVGEPAAVRPAAIGSIKIVSWNIERGAEFQRIAATLESLAPDVILLQEVDRYCRRSGDRDVARELARLLGMNWVMVGEFQEIGEARGAAAAVTGQAILSRDTITEPGTVIFADQSWLRWRLNPMQPRRGGRLALHARTAGLLVYSVHLESGGTDALRTRQLREVLADDIWRRGEDVVIAGDFNNAAAYQSSMFAGLSAGGFVDALGPSTGRDRRTSIRHRHPIDWIFVKGARPSGGRVITVNDASDHYPLVATIDRNR